MKAIWFAPADLAAENLLLKASHADVYNIQVGKWEEPASCPVDAGPICTFMGLNWLWLLTSTGQLCFGKDPITT
jgi:hypothetical protein